MKYEQIRNLSNESFRRLTGIKRQTSEKIVKILLEGDKNKKNNWSKWLNGKINRARAGKGTGTGRGTGLQFRKKSIFIF